MSNELGKRKVLKAVRSAVRLKHSLAADDELAVVLPRVEQAYDRAMRNRQVFQLDWGSLLEGDK